jgi:hypothetical protein
MARRARRDMPTELVACCARRVWVGGKAEPLCLSHVPGNEALRRAYERGQRREPTPEEVQRAIDFFERSLGRNRMTALHQMDLMPASQDSQTLPYAY